MSCVWGQRASGGGRARGRKTRFVFEGGPPACIPHHCSHCSVSFKTIISYIDEQFERYLHDESGLNRRHIVDNRVHCCFYFISPFGHGYVARWPGPEPPNRL